MKKIAINKNKLPKLSLSENPFQSLIHSIISQQLSSRSAQAIYKRFVDLWPQRFPLPKEVLLKNEEELRAIGLSKGKISYIRDLSLKFLSKTIDTSKFNKMNDQEIINHLIQVKGIGEWTAHMFLIFALNRPDVLPTGDLAIRKGFVKAFGLKKEPTNERMKKLAKEYEGERTYLSLYLWSIMDEGAVTW